MNVQEFRAQHPGAYDDLSDQQIADGLYTKHYSDMPRAEFDAKFLGAGASQPSAPGMPRQGQSAASAPALPTSIGDAFMAVPKAAGKLAYGAGKAIVEDAVNYPQARLLDPAVQAYRSIRGLGESDPAKRHQNAQPTPDEAARDRNARAFETTIAMGGPAEKVMAGTVGRLPGLLGRVATNAGTGAVLGGTDAGIRANDMRAVPAGAAGGATLGWLLGELGHAAVKAPKGAPGIAPPAVEGVSDLSRMKANPENPVRAKENARGLKGLLMGFHAPEPLLVGKKLSSGQGLPGAVVEARSRIQDAPEEGVLAIKDILDKHLSGTGNRAQQAELIRQHMTAAGLVSDLERGAKPPEGFTPQQIENDYIETAIAVSKDPEVQAAVNALRANSEKWHNEFTSRGFNVGKIKDYTPIRSLEHTESLLPEAERAGRTPSFFKSRGKKADLRDYDVVRHLAEYETAARKKIAEDDFFTKIQNDPMNLAGTEEGRKALAKDGIPEGYVRYEAPMGSPGFGKAREAKVSSVSKEARRALLVRKDLIQRAAREADEAATGALNRLEHSRKKANLLADNAKAVTRARESAERSLEIAKKREARLLADMTPEQRNAATLSRNSANATVVNRELRLQRLTEREKVLIEKAKVAADKVARSEVQRGATAKAMQKRAASLMAKAEKVGQKAERIKSQSSKKAVTLVIPTDVAESLSHFYERPMGHAARVADKAGQFMARTATTYNIANRAVNLPSDILTMLAGPAGEKGTFTSGIAGRRAARIPGALGSMLKQSFGGTSEAANAGRKMGAVSGTFQKEIGGVDVPHDLADYYYPTPMKERTAPARLAKKALGAPFDFMRRLSTATEAAPRLATSQEASARGLPADEIRRLAHESTLPYGAGASKFARSKPAKAIARFASYPSLADVRVVQGLTKGGSRARYAALLTIPPAVAAELNTRDAEHSAAEKRLKPWIKKSLHFLVKQEDGSFEVVVVRGDPFSEATSRWGLGQLSGRVVKAAKGVEPLDFKSAPSDVRDAYMNFYPIGPIAESIKGESKYGKKMSPLDRAANVLPILRYGKEAFEETEKGGPKAGAKYVIEQQLGAGARPVRGKAAFQK